MEIIYEPQHTAGIRALDTMYPTYSMYFSENIEKQGMDFATTYGYVLSGMASIYANQQNWWLVNKNYFAFHGTWTIENASDDFEMWTVTKIGYKCMPMLGQTENNGRLSYIDGCSDSVLVSMPRMGDPVLNYLHFPTGIYQTQHTHPSIRMGVVIDGEGEAFQEQSNYSDGWVKPLKKGCMFMLNTGYLIGSVFNASNSSSGMFL